MAAVLFGSSSGEESKERNVNKGEMYSSEYSRVAEPIGYFVYTHVVCIGKDLF